MKLTKVDKDFLISKVLRESFKPKFDEWEKQLKEKIQAKVFADHPVFERLLKDKDAKQYLYINSPYSVLVNNFEPKMPDYLGKYLTEWVNFRSIEVPHYMGSIKIEDKYYAELWKKYQDAHDVLINMLNSYATREKFLADFPEYKDYLPEVAKIGLPMTAPSQVRAELSELGITAQ